MSFSDSWTQQHPAVYSQQSQFSQGFESENRYTRTFKSIYEAIAVLSWSMMNETASEVIEHARPDGGAFQLACACKCFPLIGSQKRFFNQGDY